MSNFAKNSTFIVLALAALLGSEVVYSAPVGSISVKLGASSINVNEGDIVKISGNIIYISDKGYSENDWSDNYTSSRTASYLTDINWKLIIPGTENETVQGYSQSFSLDKKFSDEGDYFVNITGNFTDAASISSSSRYYTNTGNWYYRTWKCGFFGSRTCGDWFWESTGGYYSYNQSSSSISGAGVFSDTLKITVNNLAPIISSLIAPNTVNIGDSFNFSVTASDPGADNLTYAWDLNEDSIYDDYFGIAGSSSFTHASPHTIGVQVSDGDGGVTTQRYNIEVNPLPNSVPEPSSTILIGLGLAVLAYQKHRKSFDV